MPPMISSARTRTSASFAQVIDGYGKAFVGVGTRRLYRLTATTLIEAEGRLTDGARGTSNAIQSI